MKSFAIITSHAPSLTNFRAPLIRMLSEEGVKVFALAPNFNDRTRAAVKDLGAEPIDIPMSRTGMNPISDLWNTLELSKILRRLSPDVTLGYFIKPVIFGTLASWLARVPRRIAMVEGLGYLFTPCGEVESVKRSSLKRMALILYRLGMSRAHKVVFLNPDDIEELVFHNVLPEKKAFLLGGIGVNLEKWPHRNPPTKPVTFLLVARLLREKGVFQYAEAARIIKDKYPEVRFILLGGLDSNPGSVTQEEVDCWVQDGYLEWHGHVPVQPWMEKASVFVLPSYREGLPVSIQEAMAMGRAIITTDVPGCRETVNDGVNGYLIPPRNSQRLAERMEEFVVNPSQITSMGEESYRIAQDRFDAEKVNQRLLGVLKGSDI